MDETRDPRPPLSSHPRAGRLIAYREGRLAEGERATIQEHLSLCRRCSTLLLELRAFEQGTNATEELPTENGDDDGSREGNPVDSNREEAWLALRRRLPPAPPAARHHLPASSRRPREPWLATAATVLLVVSLGLAARWAVLLQRERQQSVAIELRLAEQASALVAAQRSAAEAARQLDEAQERLSRLQAGPSGTERADRERRLEARIVELSQALERLRQRVEVQGGGPGPELAVTPRFSLRGQTSREPYLRPGGAGNPLPWAERWTLAVDTAAFPLFPDYRFELAQPDGTLLWSGRRPASAVVGDAGMAITLAGLVPGRYELRVEGLSSRRTELLGEFRLDVASP